MRKKFNAAGLCVPGRHYMVDISGKIDQIVGLVEEGEYFTIDRPRQFGKTTTLSLLEKRLNQREGYQALKISFEEIDAETYNKQESFIRVCLAPRFEPGAGPRAGRDFPYARIVDSRFPKISIDIPW